MLERSINTGAARSGCRSFVRIHYDAAELYGCVTECCRQEKDSGAIRKVSSFSSSPTALHRQMVRLMTSQRETCVSLWVVGSETFVRSRTGLADQCVTVT